MEKNEAIKILEEQYKTVSMCVSSSYCLKHNKAIKMAIDALSADGDTISRKAAIEALNKLSESTYEVDYGVVDCDDAIGEIEQLPPAQRKPHWIPVTENTLPDKGRVVVVCGDKGTWDYGTYRGHGGDIHFWHWKKNTYKRVYWWMYKEDALPVPYRKEK